MEKHTRIDKDDICKAEKLQDFIWEIIKNAIRLNNQLSEVLKRGKVHPETKTD